MKKILFLTKYDRNGASSRYRTYNYIPYLNGIEYTLSPLLTGKYLESRFRFSKTARLRFVLQSYLKRIMFLTNVYKYDLLVIEYELFPYFPAIFERLLKLLKIPFILDYDDAIFHQYDLHKNNIVRFFLKEKISTVMRLSNEVIVGNSYLFKHAEQAGAKNIHIIPTVIDLKNYNISLNHQKEKVFTIVWIGSPSTTPYLQEILPALRILSQQYPICLRLIGASDINILDINVDYKVWEEDKEVQYISECHVGIMPLPHTPWASGKCGFKLIQYMACGLPVIASPVGVNIDIIKHNENGFLAKTTEDWVDAISNIFNNREEIKNMGEVGRKMVENKYSIKNTKKEYFKTILKYI